MKGSEHQAILFGAFEALPVSGELRKAGRRISLQEQPFRLLMLLLEHHGEVVTRTEIRDKIWGATSVDFEEGINTAVRKLRDALGDSATNPRFIETLPRRGYRFIAPVEIAGTTPGDLEPKQPLSKGYRVIVICGITAAIAAGLLVWKSIVSQDPGWEASTPMQLTRDSGLTSEPVISRDGKLLAYASDRAGDGNLDIWVQHINGGEARRLTDHKADDRQPEISPDSSSVIFRSERDPRGIYSVPILRGGEPKLLIKDGYVPRFSPDGSRIAYAVGLFGAGGFRGRLQIYETATASTKSLLPDYTVVGPVAWSPDGESLVFVGKGAWSIEPLHLWMTSANSSPATRISTTPVTEDSNVGQVSTLSVAWFRNQIIASVQQRDNLNLWAGTVAPEKRELTGQLSRLTLGSGNEALPSVSADGKLVFANHTYSIGIWEVTPGKDGAVAAFRRLTRDRAMNYGPSISADGSKMTYISDRSGNSEVWLRDLASGNEAPLTSSPRAEVFVTISRDGQQIAFWDRTDTYVAPITGAPPRLLCQNCGRPDDWAADGKLITHGLSLEGISVRDTTTSSFTKIIAHETRHTTAPDVSPDGKWLVFHMAENLVSPDRRVQGKRQIFIVPYKSESIPFSNWTAVTDGTALDREPKWSPDGNRIYFLSDRDGFRCIWARNLDRRTKLPVDSIYPVVHLHDAHLSLLHVPNTGNVSLCPVGDKLILAIGELTGNVWMTELGQP